MNITSARIIKRQLEALGSTVEELCYKTTDPNLIEFRRNLKAALRALTEYQYSLEDAAVETAL